MHNKFFALPLLLGLSACASWFESSDTAPQPVAAPEIQNQVQLKEQERWSTGSAHGRFFAPALTARGIWLASNQGLSFIRQNQKTDMAEDVPLATGVVADELGAYVLTIHGELRAYAEDGRLRWQQANLGAVQSLPVLAEGRVLVRGLDGRIRAFNNTDGKNLWQFEGRTAALNLHSNLGLKVADGRIYAGFSGGRLLALDLASGKQIWEAEVTIPRGATDLERLTDVVGTPWVDQNQVCAVAYQGRLACFDRSTGAMRWARELSSSTGLGDGKALALNDVVSALYHFDAEGQLLWKQPALYARNLTAPVVWRDWLVAGDFEGLLHFFDPKTGELVGRYDMGNAIRISPQVSEQGLLVQDEAGDVVLLQ